MVHKIILIFAIFIMLSGCESRTETQQLTEDEKNIAAALLMIMSDRIATGVYDEHPIVHLLDDAVVKVSYVQGYLWIGNEFTECDALLEVSEEGITCFLQTPEPAADESTYAVFNIGRKEDGTYYSHVFGFYPAWNSLEERLERSTEYQPVEEHMRSFELYIPPRTE